MTGMTRKEFLELAAGATFGCALPVALRAGESTTSANGQGLLMIPYPSKPWTQATRLIGDRPQLGLAALRDTAPSFGRLPLYNDFTLVSDGEGRWHCIGILFEGTRAEDFRQDRLFHYVSDSLQGPYRSLGYVDLGYGKKSGVWAPFVFREGDRTLMFYATMADNQLSIRVAEALDPGMRSWRRGIGGKEVLVVSEPSARDPQVIKDRRTGRYFLYYVSEERVGPNTKNVVRVRTSNDLLTWGEPKTVLGTPPGYVAAESVFVLQKGQYYFLWISGFDYSEMSLYVSKDPFNFGGAVANRIEEQPGHACEIVQTQGRYWMASVAIASVRGLPFGQDLPIAQHDLEGVYLQPLEWRAASAGEEERVFTS